jgi:hypothetical protein
VTPQEKEETRTYETHSGVSSEEELIHAYSEVRRVAESLLGAGLIGCHGVHGTTGGEEIGTEVFIGTVLKLRAQGWRNLTVL